MSDNLSYSIGSPDSSTEMLAIAERIAKQKRLGTDPVKHVDGSGKPLPGSALDILTRLRERSMDSETLLTQPPGKWHIRGLIKEGQFGLMLGKWKAGKSLAAVHAAHCVALGLPWAPAADGLGKPFGEIVKSGNVLYVASEGGGALRNRVDAWLRQHDPDGTHRANSPHKIFWFTERVSLLDPCHVKALMDFAQERKICFVVIDTLASSISGADAKGGNIENDNAAMTLLMENAALIAAHVGGSGFFVAHPPKGSDDNTRGAGAIEASSRFKLLVTEANGARAVQLAFNNEAATDGAETFFKIESVNVGEDDQGEPILAPVYVSASGSYTSHASPQELNGLKAVFNALDDENRIDRRTATEALKGAGIKSPNSIFNRLMKSGMVEGHGKKNRRGSYDFYRVTKAGEKRLMVKLPGEKRMPCPAEIENDRRRAEENAKVGTDAATLARIESQQDKVMDQAMNATLEDFGCTEVTAP